MKVLTVIKTADGAKWSVPMAEALIRRSHEVTYLLPRTRGALPELAESRGIRVDLAGAPREGRSVPAQLAGLVELRRQFEAFDPDVIVTHLYASALAARFANILRPTPTIFMSAGPLYLENHAILAAERLAWRMDSHIICSSAHLYARYRRLGVPRERLSVVPYGVDPKQFVPVTQPKREAARSLLEIEPNENVLLMCAMFYTPKRLVHRGAGIKGHEVVLAAWDRFKRQGGEGRLLLVGGGFGPGGERYRTLLKEQTLRRGIGGVEWVGPVADVRPYYYAADASVSPSLSENLGAPAEASALGIPSIGSDVGGIPEVVVDGWSGWLVPPGRPKELADTIGSAFGAGAAQLALMGRRAAARARELLDLGECTNAFADVVERVAGSHRP